MQVPEYYYDPIFGPLIKQVISIVDKAYGRKSCDYEHPESTYGADDALPCGRDVLPGEKRCERHLQKD